MLPGVFFLMTVQDIVRNNNQQMVLDHLENIETSFYAM